MSASISRIRIFAADGNRSTPPVADVVFRERTFFSRTPLLRYIWPRGTLAATLGCYLTCLCLLASQAYAPRSEQADYPVHTFRLAVARWFRNDWRVWHCANIGRFSLVHIRRHDHLRRCSLYFLGWAPQWWFDHQRRSVWPDRKCLRRPRGWALGIRIAWDRSPEGSRRHFSVRVGRASGIFKTSVKIMTAPFGSCEATTMSQTTPMPYYGSCREVLRKS